MSIELALCKNEICISFIPILVVIALYAVNFFLFNGNVTSGFKILVGTLLAVQFYLILRGLWLDSGYQVSWNNEWFGTITWQAILIAFVMFFVTIYSKTVLSKIAYVVQCAATAIIMLNMIPEVSGNHLAITFLSIMVILLIASTVIVFGQFGLNQKQEQKV